MHTDAKEMLAPSSSQLRYLWNLDNMCAQKYMDMPLRQCSSNEPPDEPGAKCLSVAMMSLLENQITDMWRKMSIFLEIFHDDTKPELGYRLRVKSDLPIKVSIKPGDQLIVGWKAVIPKSDSSPSTHLYLRSDMAEHNQYLGGPISYCNWAQKKECNISVIQVSHGSGRHLVRAESKFLSAGTELLWDYGQTKMTTFSNESWFQPECCSIASPIPVNPSKKIFKRKKIIMEVYKERCVLCGQPYKANRRDWTDRKCQKKVHFLNSHANFLGTDWDGFGLYDPSAFTVDYRRALLECERLSHFLSRLHSDSWKAVPSCAVMSKQERETLDDDTLMKIYTKRSNLLKKLGSIAVRGNSTPTMAKHLHPIRPSSWDEIFPRGAKPLRKYALPKSERDILTPGIIEHSLQDVLMVLNIKEEAEEESDTSEDM